MALKKSVLRGIIKNEDATIEERVSELLDLLHSEVDSVKDERDELKDQLAEAQNSKNDDEADKWQKKYEKEHEDFEAYKSDVQKEKTKEAKVNALKDLLNDADLSEKGIAKALKYTRLDELELDEDGKFKTGKELLKSIKEEWADYVTVSDTKGIDLNSKDVPGTASGARMTKDQILAVADTSQRQKLISENLDLFRR